MTSLRRFTRWTRRSKPRSVESASWSRLTSSSFASSLDSTTTDSPNSCASVHSCLGTTTVFRSGTLQTRFHIWQKKNEKTKISRFHIWQKTKKKNEDFTFPYLAKTKNEDFTFPYLAKKNENNEDFTFPYLAKTKKRRLHVSIFGKNEKRRLHVSIFGKKKRKKNEDFTFPYLAKTKKRRLHVSKFAKKTKTSRFHILQKTKTLFSLLCKKSCN